MPSYLSRRGSCSDISGFAAVSETNPFFAKPLSIQGLTDLAVTACEFAALELPVERVFITENEINGLAFPDVRGSLVIFRFGLRPERALYDDLRYNRLGQRLRLEQERIPYRWVERALQLQIF